MGKKIVDKLDKMLCSMRELLDKHDGSTLQAIYANIRDGAASVKESITRNERARSLLEDIKKLTEDLGAAIKAGDRKLSGKIMETLEKKVQEYKKEQDGEEKKDPPALEE